MAHTFHASCVLHYAQRKNEDVGDNDQESNTILSMNHLGFYSFKIQSANGTCE